MLNMEVLELVRNLTCQRVNGLPIYFSLSLFRHIFSFPPPISRARHLLWRFWSPFSSSNLDHSTSLAISIFIFLIQSRSLHLLCPDWKTNLFCLEEIDDSRPIVLVRNGDGIDSTVLLKREEDLVMICSFFLLKFPTFGDPIGMWQG